ncbi:MAG TPA: glycosyl hydrolase family 18 protein [Candidatus Polarisedimenticolia bacterium]|nr:glycosyl hydrolase family 18 protein [Candidatus Polarisedimenticolia bacterium]
MSTHLLPRLFRGALLTLLALAASISPSYAQNHKQGKILGGYFEEWSIYYAGYNIANLQQNGVADKLTHLFYAFGNVTTSPAPACAIADTWADYQSPFLPSVNGSPYLGPLFGNFAAIQQLKALHPNLKVVMSLGGASAVNTAAFVSAAGTAAGRQALAASCINMFVNGNIAAGITAPGLFDGFNIDWEFPTATDTQNFTALLAEFRSQLNALSKTTGKQYSLSFDGPAGAQNYVNIDLKKAAQQVDFITIDGYNYSGSWVTQTNDASPLFDSRHDPLFGQNLDINDTVDAYLKAGVPPSKYTMGLPLYAAGWTGVSNANQGLYQNSTGPSPVLLANGTGLCTDLSGSTPGCDTLLTPGLLTYSTLSTLTSNGYKNHFDPQRIAVSLYDRTSGTFYTYDDPATAFLKMIYLDLKVPGGLGGAYVWAVKDDDANGTMVKTMAAGLGR